VKTTRKALCELSVDQITMDNMKDFAKAMKTQVEGTITNIEGIVGKAKGNKLVSPISVTQLKTHAQNLEINRKLLNQILAAGKPNLKFARSKLIASGALIKASTTLLDFIKKALAMKSDA